MKRFLASLLAVFMLFSLLPVFSVYAEIEPAELSYDGYTKVWSDEFDGTSLNREDWNVELHEPGWVNSELQAYVDTDEVLSVKDGSLYITPVKKPTIGGQNYYSGRITTQNKQDFTYGLFEIRAKVPDGLGYLPAFWLMATDENEYGQWPRCGEIDCMEVMGQSTSTCYGTVHYGNPHSESQGTYVLSDSASFSSGYHTFACEWLPGEIRWYVDGNLYHMENDWYSTTDGLGTVTYPAPFDQPFYIILNLAIGGSWVGNPDETTSFDNNPYVIDYVRVYQKDSYDENVTRPEKEVTLASAGADGNYLTPDHWTFLTAQGGVGSADISAEQIVISTEKAGSVDYSIQLVQPNMPLVKGAEYEVTFTASATEARTMHVDMKAPDRGWRCYMPTQNPELTEKEQTFTYTFVMADDTDSNGRLEFNMGAAHSTAGITLKDISVKKLADPDPSKKDEKAVLSNGSYIYNGSFREGEGRLGSWTLSKAENTSVTSFADGRRLCVKDELTISQENLAFKSGTPYILTFNAETEKGGKLTAVVGGIPSGLELIAGRQDYSIRFPADTVYTNSDVSITIAASGISYLDDVKLTEDAMIKNGSFSGGLTGYEVYVDSSAKATYVVDSLSEDNALDVTVEDTGDADWKVQIKQNHVSLEKGKTYTLTFDAKSDMDRKIRVILQGQEALGWPVYSENGIVEVGKDFQTYTITFTMQQDSDPDAFLSICLGAVEQRIMKQHRVVIDNISLSEAS